MISDNYVTGDNIYLRELQNFFFEVLGMMSITHYGAVGDGRVDNYGPLQVAIDDAHRRGLNFLYVPYGRFIYTGELINIGDLIFMGNPHAHIVNIRTGEEIEIHQFGWLSDNYYSKIEADDKFVNVSGDHMTGSLSIGENSSASGYYAFAQGNTCQASGGNSHAEGWHTTASGVQAHAEGHETTASGDYSHTEGYSTTASNTRAHAEGYGTISSGNAAHAEGGYTTASKYGAHAEGVSSQATGNQAHAEGFSTVASGGVSHAEGSYSQATELDSHAEGYSTTASGQNSHAGGHFSVASGMDSFSHGHRTTATRNAQFVVGSGNVIESGEPNTYESTTGMFIVGNGTRGSDGTIAIPSNALKCTFEGNLYIAGTVTPNGADYAECVEWLDENPDNEDRVGKFVVLVGNKMRIANSEDSKEIMGVVSAKPTVLGDTYDSYWHGKYVTDVYGRIQYETVEYPEIRDDEGNIVSPATTQQVPILSPNYDPTLDYISRLQRKEYGNFAMLGKLVAEDDGTCEVGGYCFPDDNGIATKKYEGFYVMERIDVNHIRIFVR